MARSGEFTHGGSDGKNLVLLLRAIPNIIAYALTWFGLGTWLPADPLVSLPEGIPMCCTIIGAVFTVFLLVVNLITPYTHRVK